MPHSPWLLGIWVVLLMQNVLLDAALLFDHHAAILGWLLTAVKPKKALSATHMCTQYYHVRSNVIMWVKYYHMDKMWDELLSCGMKFFQFIVYVIMWDELLSCGMK